MGKIFTLKKGDTRPLLRPRPKNPDGTPYDATGSVLHTLFIWLSDGSVLQRTMTKITDSPCLLGYDWITTDWDPVSAGGLVGGLYAVDPPLAPGVLEHRMEYEVVGPGTTRLTFPNADYDILRIHSDIGQG